MVLLFSAPASGLADDHSDEDVAEVQDHGIAEEYDGGDAENPLSTGEQPSVEKESEPEKTPAVEDPPATEDSPAARSEDPVEAKEEGSKEDPPGDFLAMDYRREPSPRRWMLEIKFGPYKPAVDSEPGLSGEPYYDIFACPPGRSCSGRWPGTAAMSAIELDMHLWKGHGALGIAGSVGFFRIRGYSLVQEDPEQPYDPELNPWIASGDRTALNIMPLVLQAVYRWDYAARTWSVPLVPYIKAGGVYALWWIEGPDGKTARFGEGGGKARGGTFGYQINIGLALQLDFLEPGAAKTMDNELGINHSYIFCEFVHSQVRWGRGDRMHIGMPATFFAGLAIEF